MARDFKSSPNSLPASSSELKAKLSMAAGMLAVGVICIITAAQIGTVHVNAGDIKVVMGKGHDGFTMDIVSRTCPPNCGFDIDWRPLAR